MNIYQPTLISRDFSFVKNVISDLNGPIIKLYCADLDTNFGFNEFNYTDSNIKKAVLNNIRQQYITNGCVILHTTNCNPSDRIKIECVVPYNGYIFTDDISTYTDNQIHHVIMDRIIRYIKFIDQIEVAPLAFNYGYCEFDNWPELNKDIYEIMAKISIHGPLILDFDEHSYLFNIPCNLLIKNKLTGDYFVFKPWTTTDDIFSKQKMNPIVLSPINNDLIKYNTKV